MFLEGVAVPDELVLTLALKLRRAVSSRPRLSRTMKP
jgi:hypothetical protein